MQNIANTVCNKEWLESIFPASKTNEFFEALFGGAEEGAYDISLVYRSSSEDKVAMAFDLHQRPGQCLRCNLTYGLPQVFARHPILNVAGVAKKVADACGWPKMHWSLGNTEEHSEALHSIPFTVFRD